MTDPLADAVERVLPSVLSDLVDLVRIESVWADPSRRDEVHRSADAVATLLDKLREHNLITVVGGPAAANPRSSKPV